MQNARQLADIYHGFVAMLADRRREFGGDGSGRLHEKPRLSKRRQTTVGAAPISSPELVKIMRLPQPIRATGVVVNHGGVHADFGSKDIRADQDSAKGADLG
jgi:hypothetical protein